MILIVFIYVGVHNVVTNQHKVQLKEIELKSKQTEIIELNQKYDEVIQLKTKTQKEKEAQAKKIKKLEEQRRALQRDLQAKADKQAKEQERLARASDKALGVGTASASGCGDNKYANFIYMKESNCNVSAVNSIGCRGIGQACPGSKLPCGADYACQNKWFTNYAMTRYGSWERAYNFWINNHWW